MIKNLFIIISFLILARIKSDGQGFNHTFLLGYDVALFDTNVTSTKARLNFTNSNSSIQPETRKMAFRASQSNISDSLGNLLIVTNGCWIANAIGDTMQNGNGLNPNTCTSNWCDSTSGIPVWNSNIIIPYPDNTNKYVLFHQTCNYNFNGLPSELYYSVIDMTLDSGLGGVVQNQKNIIAINNILMPGVSATRHANGRDWWIIAIAANSDSLYKILLTPQGIINISCQTFGLAAPISVGQSKFSQDGTKFAYHNRIFPPGGSPITHEIRYFDFDRCTGLFSNSSVITYIDQNSGNGLAFSSDSKYLYFTTFLKVLQINTDTTDMQASLKVVALNDTFYSPNYPFITDFWLMYLAANGKIYISSGSSVIDLHYIDNPDSSGIACNVMQHALHIPCYSGRGNVNHPNYYLGRLQGSPCDTIQWTGLEEIQHDFRFRIYPNPISNNTLHIGYLLPQNKVGEFQIYDITGKIVFKYNLPPWSNEQSFSLPKLSNGIYQCIIKSNNSIATKKLIVIADDQ